MLARRIICSAQAKRSLVTGSSSELLFLTMPDTVAALKRRADAFEEENRRLRARLTQTP